MEPTRPGIVAGATPHGSLRRWILAVGLIAAAPHAALAQSPPIVYPSHGQSFQQQAQDEGICRGWAQQQTGFNPMQGPVNYGGPPQPGGEMIRGAARGAALGAIGGAIGGNAGRGAAVGSGVGAAAGLMRRHDAHRAHSQAQQQAVAQYNQQLGIYNRAFAVCMQGRGYAVN